MRNTYHHHCLIHWNTSVAETGGLDACVDSIFMPAKEMFNSDTLGSGLSGAFFTYD